MQIFVVPSWYKSKRFPENSIFIFEQAKALAKLGHKIVVLSVQPISIIRWRKANTEIEFVMDGDIATYYTEIYTFAPSMFKKTYISMFYEALCKLFKQAIAIHGLPDVLYAHFTFAGGYCAIPLAKKYSIPLVIEEHYSGFIDIRIAKSFNKYLLRAINESDKFICVSENLKSAILKITKPTKEPIVISNMINPCFTFHPNTEKDNFIFFSMGSLIHRKGFEILINAFSKVFKGKDNVKLKIAGQGPDKQKLQHLIDKHQLNKQVTLVGQLSREQTLDLYKQCHCFVLASKAETYGLVYREAMAVGRPIISTKHGGFSSKDWHKEYGYLVDIDDEVRLSDAMKHVYVHYSSYDQHKISDLCLSDCAEKSVIRKIEATLQSCCKK